MVMIYAANPCGDGTENWYVWNMSDVGEMARFVGSMEDAVLVADALNKIESYTQGKPSRREIECFVDSRGVSHKSITAVYKKEDATVMSDQQLGEAYKEVME